MFQEQSRKVVPFPLFGLLLPIAMLVGCTNPNDQSRQWPRRPIQIICFAAPGGGTDTVSRTIARAMESSLGTKINVINKEGARGGAAMRDIWSRDHDGYRWGGFSESVIAAPVMNAHHTTVKDWTFFLVAGAPGVVSVSADSPHETLESLVKEAKSRPGQINAAASVIGGIWHTKLVLLEKATGASFNYIPYSGSNPSQLALLSGEVDVVLTSISEQAELIKSRQVRPLAMAEVDAFDFPDLMTIVSAAERYPEIADFQLKQWLGLALPRDVPADTLAMIGESFEKAMQSDELQAVLRTRLLSPYSMWGDEANQLVSSMESQWTWMLHDLGITERSPEELGIPRP